MRKALAVSALLLAVGCAPEIDRRTRCETHAQCFRDELCSNGQCRPKLGPQGPGGPPAPDASGASDAVATSDADTEDGVGFEIALRLGTIDAALSGYIDIGFCPDPTKTASQGDALSSAPACDDAFFLRATAQLDGKIRLLAMRTAGGKVVSKSGDVSVKSDSSIEIWFYATAWPGDPTATTSAQLTVLTESGSGIDFDASTETRYLGKFGAANLSKEFSGPACLEAVNQTFKGTLSNVAVSANDAPIPLTTLVESELEKMGDWTPDTSWIDFEVDACDEQYFLVTLTAP